MPLSKSTLRKEIQRRYRRCPIDCKRVETEITTLGDFFAVLHSVLEQDKVFWFRGHPRVEYKLVPSALRYRQSKRRETALGLVNEMKRFMEMKLPRPPAADDDLGWAQVAQHYGLPTRLLDWTYNTSVALFFACWKDPNRDGLVAILSPIGLNQEGDPKSPRIFNMQNDREFINPYFKLGSDAQPKGTRTIAITPTWNNERIALQHGVFTLHGSWRFALDRHQASSLVYVPILRVTLHPPAADCTDSGGSCPVVR
jgi:hypothetical protein